VFLLEPARTQFDLSFRIFRIPVRVHPMFWVVMAFLGWRGGPVPGEGGTFLLGVLAWVAACFVSILIHEMGHVFMGRLFGTDGHIVLYSFGGLAIGSNALSNGAKRALVSFAGPLAQFLLLGVVMLVIYYFIAPAPLRPLLTLDWSLYDRLHWMLLEQQMVVQRFFSGMLFINLFWPLLNLLPIWPLDGGQISRELCVGVAGERGVSLSLGISLLLAGLLAVNALMTIRRDDGTPFIGSGKPLIPLVGGLLAGGGVFMALLFGLLAIQSLQMLQSIDAARRWREEHWDE
jgi:stage IV sporulation protein FB